MIIWKRGILQIMVCPIERSQVWILTIWAGQHEVRFTDIRGVQFIDYLPSPILAVAATSSFCAAALLSGSVVVYSHTGRRCVFQLAYSTQSLTSTPG
jgi:hypothetical protein